MNHNRLPKTLLFALAAQLAVGATTNSFVVIDGVSDGHSYPAICYDLANHLSNRQVWQANLLTINDLSGAYYFDRLDAEDKYRRSGWFYSELMKVSDAESRIGIQHAAWLLSVSSGPSAGAARWQAAAKLAAHDHYGSVDFSSLRFIEAVSGSSRVHGLLIGGFSTSASEVPEPSTWTVVVAGRRRVRAAGPPDDQRRT